MFNFSLQMPTKILFGKGQIANLKDEIPKNAKVLITYGGGSVLKNGVMDQVHRALEGVEYYEFGGIEPNPEYETLIKALDVIKSHNVDFLLPVGGGSVFDGTKFIAAAAKYTRPDLWEILTTHGEYVTDCIPLGGVLTLPATGSESNNAAVISRRSTGDKLDFFFDGCKPQFAVLDPETTYSLPERQTANGVVDAFIHTAEQYVTYPVDAKIQDGFAETILKTLINDGPIAMERPTNYDARANIMWSATVALIGIIGNGVPGDWVSHMMGHEMTAMYGLDHARTLAILMPAVWDYCRKDKNEKLLQYAKNVWRIVEGSDDEIIDAAIRKTREFFESLGCPTHFSDYGLDTSKIPLMVEKLKEHEKFGLGERENINPGDMEKIYHLCL